MFNYIVFMLNKFYIKKVFLKFSYEFYFVIKIIPMIHTTIPISCWLVPCSLYMITPTMTNAIARQMFAIRDAELTLAPARYRKIYPSSRPTMQIPRAMLAQFNLDNSNVVFAISVL